MAKVTCRHCGARTKIPDCKADRRAHTAWTHCVTIDWVFYGKGRGSCPECNLFSRLNNPEKEPANVVS